MTISKKLASGVFGFFAGLIMGPFAAVGKWFSIIREEAIGHELRLNKNPRCSGMIIGIPIFLVGGLLYGPVRGAIIGYQTGIGDQIGLKQLSKSIAGEMFTYDPFYDDIITPAVTREYPDECLISYRKFHPAGLLQRLTHETLNEQPLCLKSPIINANLKKTDDLKTAKTNTVRSNFSLKI